MAKRDAALLVFAKAPVPGQAKTRLIPVLGAAGAAELHARLVRHTLTQAVAAEVGPVALWCAPDDRHPFFAECARDFGVELQGQQGDDLGQRMAHALACSLHTFRRILLIGSDCPTLGAAALRDAAQRLEGNAAMFVPVEDGGYALVGVREAVPPIFDDVAWGGAAVMAQTRAHMRAQGLCWQELPPLADIDTPRDLRRLKQTHPALLEGIVELGGHAVSYIETPPSYRFPWYVRLFLLNQRRRYGRELEPARLWGRSPKVFAALSLLYGALDRKSSPIEPALRTLVTVRVSQINWCAFCVDINSATALKRGLTEAQLEALSRFEDSPLFDERTKAALAYAEAVTYSDRRVDDALMARLKSQFDDEAVIELTALIAFQNLSSKFNSALGVEAQGFCKLPVGRLPARGE